MDKSNAFHSDVMMTLQFIPTRLRLAEDQLLQNYNRNSSDEKNKEKDEKSNIIKKSDKEEGLLLCVRSARTSLSEWVFSPYRFVLWQQLSRGRIPEI